MWFYFAHFPLCQVLVCLCLVLDAFYLLYYYYLLLWMISHGELAIFISMINIDVFYSVILKIITHTFYINFTNFHLYTTSTILIDELNLTPDKIFLHLIT